MHLVIRKGKHGVKNLSMLIIIASCKYFDHSVCNLLRALDSCSLLVKYVGVCEFKIPKANAKSLINDKLKSEHVVNISAKTPMRYNITDVIQAANNFANN